jgi:hypothetical protein
MTASCTVLKNVVGKKDSVDSSKGSSIEGVWKLLYSNFVDEDHSTEPTRYKVFVDGHFFWYQVYENEIIPDEGAAGTYSLYDNSSYRERVEYVFPEMTKLQGREIYGSYSISGNIMKTTANNIMKTTGSFSSEAVLEEVFEKVSVENKSFAEIKGFWRLLKTGRDDAPLHVTPYKMIVDDRFVYYEVDGGIISNASGMDGILEMENNTCIETVQHILPEKEEWRDKQVHYDYKVSKFETGDIMRTNNTIQSTGESYTEVFERVVNLNSSHKSIQDFRKNLYSQTLSETEF